jgi:hypothetical protein
VGGILIHAYAAAVQGLAAAALAAVAVAAPVYVVNADRTVGGLVVGHATVAQAAARFGPSARTPDGGGMVCHLSWPALGVRLTFLDFAQHACTKGALVDATITSRTHWRTALGLRVGDTGARLRALYPHAVLHHEPPSGYWLVPRRSCKETGGAPYAGLLARVAGNGRVSALVVTAGVCD